MTQGIRVSGGLAILGGPGSIPRIIALQYNPDSLSRTLQIQAIGEGQERSEAFRVKAPPIETLKLEAEIDLTDQLEAKETNAFATEFGLYPYLAALETIVYPSAAQLESNNGMASRGVLEIAPMEAPVTLFIWSKHRVLPVRVTDFSITEEAFDTSLNPIRAKVSLGMRVLSVQDVGFEHRAGRFFMAYLRRKEELAARHQGGQITQLGLSRDPLRVAPCLDRPVVTSALETAKRILPNGKEVDVRLEADRARSRNGSHCFAHMSSRRESGWIRLRSSMLGDAEQFWRICDANRAMRPDELTETTGRRLRITLPEDIPGPAMVEGIYLTLMVGPVVPVPVPQVVLDALTGISVRVTAERGRQSGFELSFSLSQRSPLHTLFLLSGAVPIPLIRVVIIVTSKGLPNVLMDGVVTRQDVSTGEGGRATLRVTGVDISEVMNLVDLTGFPYPALPVEGRVAVILAKYPRVRHHPRHRPDAVP